MFNRRSLLGLLSSIPFLGFIKPKIISASSPGGPGKPWIKQPLALEKIKDQYYWLTSVESKTVYEEDGKTVKYIQHTKTYELFESKSHGPVSTP